MLQFRGESLPPRSGSEDRQEVGHRSRLTESAAPPPCGWSPSPLGRGLLGCAAAAALDAGLLVLRAMREDFVDDAELECFLCLEEGVAVERLLDVGQALARVLDVEVVHPGADAQDFLGL